MALLNVVDGSIYIKKNKRLQLERIANKSAIEPLIICIIIEETGYPLLYRAIRQRFIFYIRSFKYLSIMRKINE